MNKNKSEFKTPFAQNIFNAKYAKFPGETWAQRVDDIVEDVCGTRWGKDIALMSKEDQDQLKDYMNRQLFFPGGRYLWYSGRGHSYFNNCFLLRAEYDTREEWGALMQRAVSCLMTGGGIGVDYSILRPKGSPLSKTGGIASGPLPLIQMVNEAGRGVMQGGSRRSAIYASLNWQHGDINEFLTVKNWDELTRQQKAIDFNYPAPLDMTNISVNYDDAALGGYTKDVGGNIIDNELASNPVFLQNVRQAMETGEPKLIIWAVIK